MENQSSHVICPFCEKPYSREFYNNSHVYFDEMSNDWTCQSEMDGDDEELMEINSVKNYSFTKTVCSFFLNLTALVLCIGAFTIVTNEVLLYIIHNSLFIQNTHISVTPNITDSVPEQSNIDILEETMCPVESIRD